MTSPSALNATKKFISLHIHISFFSHYFKSILLPGKGQFNYLFAKICQLCLAHTSLQIFNYLIYSSTRSLVSTSSSVCPKQNLSFLPHPTFKPTVFSIFCHQFFPPLFPGIHSTTKPILPSKYLFASLLQLHRHFLDQPLALFLTAATVSPNFPNLVSYSSSLSSTLLPEEFFWLVIWLSHSSAPNFLEELLSTGDKALDNTRFLIPCPISFLTAPHLILYPRNTQELSFQHTPCTNTFALFLHSKFLSQSLLFLQRLP